jgi:uncharacterized membrane protein YedE/YeeE
MDFFKAINYINLNMDILFTYFFVKGVAMLLSVETIEGWIDYLGDGHVAAILALAIGIVFGGAAQRSGFCLRSASLDLGRGRIAPSLAIWVTGFAIAILATQALIWTAVANVSEARWITARASYSGALIGAVIFGVGMALARGCPGRLIVLAGSGNIRALTSVIVFGVIVDATMRGGLAAARTEIARIWPTAGANPNLLEGLPAISGVIVGLLILVLASFLAIRSQVRLSAVIGAAFVGLSVAAGWLVTSLLAQISFDVIAVESIAFARPIGDALNMLMTGSAQDWRFHVGLVPGALIGAAFAAILFKEWRVEGFSDWIGAVHRLAGAGLMGFGAVLASGCSLGAAMTGGSVFAITAWLSLMAFVVSVIATDWLMRRAVFVRNTGICTAAT